MVRNDEGLVAVRHWNSNPSIEVISGNTYNFTPQYGASIAWVHEQNVPHLLTLRVNICCNQTKLKYFLPDEQQVRVWQTGRL